MKFKKPSDIKQQRKTLSLRLDKETVEFLKNEAKKADVTFNDLVNSVLIDYADYIKGKNK